MSRKTERSADLELVLAAILEAGRAVARVFGTDPQVWHKSPDQPVTDADLRADRILHDRLTAARPGYGWLSEESGSDRNRRDRRRVWVVDPLDGTRSFVAGYPEFGLSVGLAEDGRPVIGTVLNPARREVFWAVRGEGAFRAVVVDESVGPVVPERDGRALRERGQPVAIAREPAGRPVLLASRSEIRRGELEPFGVEEWEIRPLGSTAYKMAVIAAGQAHGYISRGEKSEWDVAGAALLVQEAGGRVTDLLGEPFRFNKRAPDVTGVVAATPGVHARLLERVAALESPRLP